MRIVLLFTSILFFAYGNAQNKIKPKKLNEDFEYLIAELKSQHQGLYEYVGENQTNIKIDSIRNTLKTPQTRLKFHEKLRYLIGLTNEGHTSIELPKWTIIKLGLSKSFLPFTVNFLMKIWLSHKTMAKILMDLKKAQKLFQLTTNK